MSLGRVMAVLGVLVYALLWVLALNGASSLVGPLAIPPVLAVLIGGGVQLNRFMGTTPRRREHFNDPEDEATR